MFVLVKDKEHIKELYRQYKRKNPSYGFKLSSIIFQSPQSIEKFKNSKK